MQKRGQATVLIILGIIILFAIIGIYAFRDSLFQSAWEKEQAAALNIPEEALEIHDYVFTCIEDTTTDALNILGMQGGYVDIPEDTIPSYGDNSFSNALEIFTGSDFKVPYWYYLSANNLQKTQMPSIASMELELENYVNNNLANCVDNDEELLTTYNFDGDEVFTSVEILDNEVLFTIVYPVHIELNEYEFDFPDFYYDTQVPLGEMYESAVDIMDSENENYIFEDLTYDMLVLNEEVPLSWGGMDCDKQEWDYEEVKESFKEILYNNILAVKIKRTNYDVSVEEERGYFELDLLNKNVDYNANVMYMTQWPLLIEAYPLQDGKLVEDSYTDAGSMSGFLRSLFCLHSYNFVYDIRYPLLISLYDQDSDFNFQFATMVVLDNNQPRENEAGGLEIQEEGIVCDSLTEEMTVYALEVDPSGSFVELEGVDVTYQCVTTSCDLGVTSGTRGSASYTGLFPACVNGNVIVEKDGYYMGEEMVTTLDTNVVSVVLEKIYELEYEIIVVDYDGNTRSPTSDETIYLTLVEEEGYMVNAFYPEYEETIELIPGEYSLFATMIKEDGLDVSVNGMQFEKCVSVPMVGIGGIFGLEKNECYEVDLDDVNLDSIMTGGLEITWVTDRYELDDASKVVFYVTEVGEAVDVEDLEDVYADLQSGYGMKEPELQ